MAIMEAVRALNEEVPTRRPMFLFLHAARHSSVPTDRSEWVRDLHLMAETLPFVRLLPRELNTIFANILDVVLSKEVFKEVEQLHFSLVKYCTL